jgi:hypothetical protein
MGMSARADGFSLVEAIIMTALVAGSLMTAAHWVADGASAGARSASASMAAVLAAHKLEQLRALRWTVDDAGVRRADLSADTSVDPPAPGGGLGLSISPEGTLEADVPGYVDYLARDGRVVATRQGALYVRRWAIAPLPLAPADGLMVQACVRPLRAVLAGDRRDPRTDPETVCAASARTRAGR